MKEKINNEVKKAHAWIRARVSSKIVISHEAWDEFCKSLPEFSNESGVRVTLLGPEPLVRELGTLAGVGIGGLWGHLIWKSLCAPTSWYQPFPPPNSFVWVIGGSLIGAWVAMKILECNVVLTTEKNGIGLCVAI